MSPEARIRTARTNLFPMRAPNHFVYFALAGSEFAADRNCTRDIAGVVIAFGGVVHYGDFTRVHASGISRVVERRRVGAGADNGGVGAPAATLARPGSH